MQLRASKFGQKAKGLPVLLWRAAMPQPEDLPVKRLLFGLLAFLFISGAYLYTLPQPNIFFAGIVLLHVVTGVAATMMMAPVLWRSLRRATFLSRLGWGLLGAGTLLGLILIYTGTTRVYW